MRLSEQPEKLRHAIIKRFYNSSDIIQYINSKPFDYTNNSEILTHVNKTLTLFGIKSYDLRLDSSYIVNFIKLNKNSLENNNYDNLIEPEFRNYKIPYWTKETVAIFTEYKMFIESYGDPDDAIEIFKELEFDGGISLWDGKEINSESETISLDNWGINKNDIEPI